MPIYEYFCVNCRHQLEALQKVSDAALSRCPACGQDSLQKQVSLSGFQLKGTGWYVTDFKNASAKPEKTETGADGAKHSTASKVEASSETKTETGDNSKAASDKTETG